MSIVVTCRHISIGAFTGGRLVAWGIVSAGAALLVGCAGLGTPYQADLPQQQVAGGYSEVRLGTRRYRVTFSATPSTRWSDLEARLLRRAAELARDNRYRWFVMEGTERNDRVYVDITPSGSRRMRYSGDYDRWNAYWRLFRYRFHLEGLNGNPLWLPAHRQRDSRRREITADVRMGRELPAPPHSFDPHAVLRRQR